MSGLSAEDRKALTAWEPHADWCDYADKSDEGCTPEFGCNVWRRRDLLAEMVEQIVARHVEAALTEAARQIQAARPPHLLRNYTEVDRAYDDAARIIRDLPR